MSAPHVLEDRQGGWVRLTLNDPENRNALSRPMVLALDAALARLEGDNQVRAIVLQGAGGVFCAGGDVREMLSASSLPLQEAARQNRRFGALLERFAALPVPLIALVQGPAMGGGCGLACVADLVLADASASFALSEPRLGLIPAQIAPFVVARLGWARAKTLALSGLRFTLAEATALGLVDFAERDDAALQARLEEIRCALHRCAPGAMATTKHLLGACRRGGLGLTLDTASVHFAQALGGPEGCEGLSAFLERRAPSWAL